jgi:hypothetical protein
MQASQVECSSRGLLTASLRDMLASVVAVYAARLRALSRNVCEECGRPQGRPAGQCAQPKG